MHAVVARSKAHPHPRDLRAAIFSVRSGSSRSRAWPAFSALCRAALLCLRRLWCRWWRYCWRCSSRTRAS